ncbi:MAG: hypothetical protein JWM36_682 [Hyphomicrobiales bacterium]|nr:hypothetical protein [Hyphomicrobiales bacterium]
MTCPSFNALGAVRYVQRETLNARRPVSLAGAATSLKVAGEAALLATGETIRQPGVVEASRDTRRMSVSRYQGPDGGQVTKILPVDGLPSRGSYGPKE